ncbi:ankyrin repeat-containing domain protein [Diaporthe sp. PMI_573]|nr:ankyrin repeat-containing domain protein [Diaporthaceae sp. PMI_573]
MSFNSSSSLDNELTALAMAILAGDISKVASLVNLGVLISDHYHWTLYHACLQGPDMLQAVLSGEVMRCRINSPDIGGDYTFHFVLRTLGSRLVTGKSSIVEMLLHNGADPFARNHLGETAIHILASRPAEEDLGLLKAILSGSGPVACLDYRNVHGDTVLVLAVVNNNIEAARVLLDMGANQNVMSEFGCMAEKYAIDQGNVDMLALLYRRQAAELV